MTVYSYVKNVYVAGVTVLSKVIMDIIENGIAAAARTDNFADAASPERVELDKYFAAFGSRFVAATWTTTPTAYKAGTIVRPTGTSEFYRVAVDHTSDATVPTPANSLPLTGGANYEYIAGPTSALAPHFIRVGASDTFAVTMIQLSATAAAATDVVNLATMEAAIADVTLNARPCSLIAFIWNPAGAGTWEYGGATVTALPAAVITGDILVFAGHPDGAVPGWSTTHYTLSSVG